jgi:hypothetical protein
MSNKNCISNSFIAINLVITFSCDNGQTANLNFHIRKKQLLIFCPDNGQTTNLNFHIRKKQLLIFCPDNGQLTKFFLKFIFKLVMYI